MKPTRLFQGIVVASVVLTFVSGLAENEWAKHLPEPLRKWTEQQQPSSLWILYDLALLIAFLVAGVGLLCFWRPARQLQVAWMVVGIGASLSRGEPQVLTRYGSTAMELAGSLSMVSLVLAYCWPPVRDRFDDKRGVE